MIPLLSHFFLFFFNDTATTEIYTLSLHDALPISSLSIAKCCSCVVRRRTAYRISGCRPGSAIFRSASDSGPACWRSRSEEHTSELQSHLNLVCRLLLEKKKKTNAQSTRQ